MLDVMLDLETMGNGPRAAIVAIGAVEFDPKTRTVGDRFYQTVDLATAVKMGGEIDASTGKVTSQQTLSRAMSRTSRAALSLSDKHAKTIFAMGLLESKTTASRRGPSTAMSAPEWMEVSGASTAFASAAWMNLSNAATDAQHRSSAAALSNRDTTRTALPSAATQSWAEARRTYAHQDD